MKVEIKSWINGDVLYACEAPSLCDAVEAAVAVGANLTGANLTGANLTGANLTDAYLTRANLARANLTDADLTGADLTGAYLARADLTDAYLTGAYLTRADLTGAYLTGAYIARAYIARANLARANLTDADRSESSAKPETERRLEWGTRRAQSRKARAEAFRARNPNVPVVEKLDLRILNAIESGAVSLEMGAWHSCETTHCRAGLSIHLAGDAGYALEKELGPERAGRAIYLASTGRAPDFFASNEAAMADIRRCAEAEV